VDWVSQSCTLPSVEQPMRVAEFGRLFSRSVLRFSRTSRTRLELVLSADALRDARGLARRESACCSFFGFEFDSAGADVVMRISVPDSHIDVLDALTERVKAASEEVS
jgi:hypothetical protein